MGFYLKLDIRHISAGYTNWIYCTWIDFFKIKWKLIIVIEDDFKY